jgi:integrase
MEIKIPHVIAIRKRGGRKGDRVLYYWRRKGHKLRRLPNDPRAPAFLAKLNQFEREAAAEAGPAAPDPETIAWLIEKYLASPDTAALAPRTVVNYRFFLNRLLPKFGHLPYAALDREAVYDLRDHFAAKPNTANEIVSALRGMLTWAVDRGILAVNVAQRPKRIYVARRHAMWSHADEKAFLDAADPTMALAFMLGAYTAQRLADICGMTWGQYNGKTIKLVQMKTERRAHRLIEVPCHADLKTVLDAAKRSSIMILTTPTGKAFKPSNFNLRWKMVSRAAGIRGLQFRDLRRTAIVRLGEAGANAIQIAAVSGHDINTSQKILETYLPRNFRMAEAAILALERDRPGTKV